MGGDQQKRREGRSEEKAEEKRIEDRREAEDKRREDGREEREGISNGTDGSRTSPALVKKPAGIADSGVPETETLSIGFGNRHWRAGGII